MGIDWWLMVEVHRSFLIPKNTNELSKELNFSWVDRLEYDVKVDVAWIQKKASQRMDLADFRAVNNWNLALYKRELMGIRQSMSVRWVDALKGWGLFADESIAEMTCIGEYVGVVKKRDRKKDRDNSYIFEYAIDTYDTGYVIDAERRGNHTRFINHSDEPNVISRWLIIDGLPRIIFFTNRKILPSEELVVDYGPYYWD
jgi:hypothetical protein